MAIFMLDQILLVCSFRTLCWNEHHLSSLRQLKVSITMKTNISSELRALVIQKKCSCLLVTDLITVCTAG